MKLAHAAIVLASLASATFVVSRAAAEEAEYLPVAAVTIYPGQAVTDAMLSDRAYPAGTAARYPIFADRAGLIGKVARRTLLPGKLIASNAVGELDLVGRGSVVQAFFSTTALVIRAPVLALQSGSLDASIQVRNVDTGKVIVGVVQADGTVRVGAP